jgi:dynactin-6
MELMADVEAPSIGNFNTFQPRSRAPSTINISDYCTLSAGTTLSSAPSNSTMDIDSDNDPVETLEPYTVIYGARSDRRVWDGKNLDAEENLRLKHIEYLREILPK